MAFREADAIECFGGGYDERQCLRIGHADVFRTENRHTAENETRVFACIDHLGQPVECGVRIGAAHGFDEGGNCVEMAVAFTIIENGAFLDGFFRDGHRDMDDAVIVRLRRFDGEFERIESGSCIAVGDVRQMVESIIVELDFLGTEAADRIFEGLPDDVFDVFIVKRLQLEDAGT